MTDARVPGEARLERVRGILRSSPTLDEAVRRALAAQSIPVPGFEITDETAQQIRRDAAPLEELIPPDALEAIVQRTGRPPMLVRNDQVELEDLSDFPVGTDALIRGTEAVIPSIGRVELLNHSMAWAGTGWVIDGDGDGRTVATNRHVAKLIARRNGDGTGSFLRSPSTGVRYGASLDFEEESGSLPGDARPFVVRRITYLADDAAPDIALMRIEGDDLPDPLELADEEVEVGDLVAIIGYPAFDSRNNVDDMARYFRDLFDVKRFAPGKILQKLSGQTTLKHDCTTLGGNSGSPLVRLDDGKVVGLHFAGVYGLENSAVGAATLKRLLSGETIALPSVPASAPSIAVEARDGAHSPDDLADRDGYDPSFLGEGFAAPWPVLSEQTQAELARPSDATDDRPFELRYTHFGTLHSVTRRQPLITAVNIDGGALVAVKRGRDKWFSDGRIPAEIQLTSADYDHRDIDRGHLVRRQDPNWDPEARPGTVSELAERANLDTFHYTNAAPQHADLNQSQQMWLGLEDYVLESARTHGFRACVFTGPINRADDPEIKPGVPAPREFWKMVVMVDADGKRLHATAYVLSQGDFLRELLEARDRTEAYEGFVLGPYRTFQVAIRDLAAATEYDLTAYLDADPLGGAGTTEAAGAPVFRDLEWTKDIVL